MLRRIEALPVPSGEKEPSGFGATRTKAERTAVGGEVSAKGFLTRERSPFWNENREKGWLAAVRNRRDSDVREENTCVTRQVTPSLDTFAVKKETPIENLT